MLPPHYLRRGDDGFRLLFFAFFGRNQDPGALFLDLALSFGVRRGRSFSPFRAVGAAPGLHPSRDGKFLALKRLGAELPEPVDGVWGPQRPFGGLGARFAVLEVLGVDRLDLVGLVGLGVERLGLEVLAGLILVWG